LKAARHWLALGVVACAAAFAGPPSSQPAPPPPDAARAATPVGAAPDAAPDDDFIEFLGADDVGDAALWAFLKKSAQRKDGTPPTPPQDAKQ
jgi:hypothetical protein